MSNSVFKKIKQAIKKHDYTIDIEPADCFSGGVDINGEEFLVMTYGDSCKSSINFGYCRVEIAEHWFECDLEDGGWDSDLLEDEDLNEDEHDEIISLIESIDGVVFGATQFDPDDMVKVYNAAYGKSINGYYVSGEEDIPIDIHDICYADSFGLSVVKGVCT